MSYNDDRLISNSFNYVKMRERSLSRMLINGKCSKTLQPFVDWYLTMFTMLGGDLKGNPTRSMVKVVRYPCTPIDGYYFI